MREMQLLCALAGQTLLVRRATAVGMNSRQFTCTLAPWVSCSAARSHGLRWGTFHHLPGVSRAPPEPFVVPQINTTRSRRHTIVRLSRALGARVLLRQLWRGRLDTGLDSRRRYVSFACCLWALIFLACFLCWSIGRTFDGSVYIFAGTLCSGNTYCHFYRETMQRVKRALRALLEGTQARAVSTMCLATGRSPIATPAQPLPPISHA
jgi:hypothetical protein